MSDAGSSNQVTYRFSSKVEDIHLKHPFFNVNAMAIIASYASNTCLNLFRLRKVNRVAYDTIENYSDDAWIKLGKNHKEVDNAVVKGNFYLFEKMISFNIPGCGCMLGYALNEAICIPKNNWKTIQLIVDSGQVEDYEDSFGLACDESQVDVMELLADKGVDLSGGDTYRPLFDACYSGRLGVIEFLLSRASLKELTKRHPYPIDKLIEFLPNVSIAKMFINAGLFSTWKEDNNAVLKNWISETRKDKVKEEVLDYVINAGVDINFPESQSPLSRAVSSRNVGFVELLLKKGANPNSDRLLWFASCYGEPVIFKLLLDYGADYKIQYNWRLYPGGREILKLYLEEGIEVDEIVKCKGLIQELENAKDLEVLKLIDAKKASLSSWAQNSESS